MLVGQKIAKRLLNCDAAYLEKCRKDGMPYERINGTIKYDMSLVYSWHRGEDFKCEKSCKKQDWIKV